MSAPVAYVSGASSGIGRGAAVLRVADGARVVLLGRDEARLAEAAAECGPLAVTAAFDAAKATEVDAVLPGLLEQTGPPDIVVHAAGQTVVGALDQLSAEDWHRQIDVNLTSIHSLNRHLWPAMVPAGGAVVLVGSTASFVGFAQDAAYVATKGAVLAMTKAMALDGAPVGIRVNAVCPGFIVTPNLEGYFDAQDDPDAARAGAAAAAPLGRMGTPADIAGAIAFLCSPDSSFVTGTSVLVDGGLLAKAPGA